MFLELCLNVGKCLTFVKLNRMYFLRLQPERRRIRHHHQRYFRVVLLVPPKCTCLSGQGLQVEVRETSRCQFFGIPRQPPRIALVISPGICVRRMRG